MSLKVLAYLLSFVLFWSGFSTIEAPTALGQPVPEQLGALTHEGGQPGLNDGSVEDHHLDDLPSQAQSDLPSETPGMLPSSLTSTPQPLATIRPHAFPSAAATSPFIAGPLRPPRSEARAG